MRRYAVVAVLLLTACGSETNSNRPGSGASQPPVTLTGTTNDHGSKEVSGSGIEVELDDFYFGPTFIKAASGAAVKVALRNEGSMDHTFTVDGGPDRTVKPGEKADVTVTATAAPLVFYCRFHRDQGMQGAVYTVTGGSGGASPGDSGSGDDGYNY